MGNSSYDEKSILNGQRSFTDAYADQWYLVGGPNSYVPYRVDLLIASSTSIAAQVLDVAFGDANDTPGPLLRVASVIIPAGAGDGTIPVVDVLVGILPVLAGGLPLASNQVLFLHLQATPGSGEIVVVTWLGGEL